jgi:cysteinyl-tRNA synthetase
LEEWAHLLQSRYNFKNDFAPEAVVGALSDDLNTPNAIAELRELFSKAKRGGFDSEMRFAANCRFLGFQHLDKPGYFQSGVQALNVEEPIIDLVPVVQQLRAATANNAPQRVHTEIVSSLASRGLGVEVSSSGIITIVSGSRSELEDKIERLIAERTKARTAKNWKESDRIRDELAAMGVVLKDSKDGTTWEIAR